MFFIKTYSDAFDLGLLETVPPFVQKVFEQHLEERKIVINEDITQDVVENIVLQIMKWNKEDKGLPTEVRKPITMYINSVGGAVLYGLNVIDVMENSKTPIHTVCLGTAYSMASYLLASGHKRYAFPNSTVLFHDGSFAVGGTSSKAKDTIAFYEKLDGKVKELVLRKTDISEELYDEKNEKEWYMFADEAKNLGVIDAILGIDIELDEVI